MKKIYQAPDTKEFTVETESMVAQTTMEVTNKTMSNKDAFSRESGGWDDDY